MKKFELKIHIKKYRLLISLFLLIMIVLVVPRQVFADSEKTTVEGTCYQFEEDSKYEFSNKEKGEKTSNDNTYGNFTISGDIANITTKDNLPVYEVSSGNISFFYTYSDEKLNAEKKSWHLIDDDGKTIDNIKLNEKIKKGALILQTSKDRKNWVDAKCMTNLFKEEPVKTNSLYTTSDVQLLNGCYYRVLVAYELEKKVGEKKILFKTVDENDIKKCVEVYEFYLVNENNKDMVDVNQTYNLGSKVRTEKWDGYFGEKEIDKKNDSHYGWDLGQFYVSGYTDKIVNNDDKVVFLKNVGDKVTLWFKLAQDIDALNGDKDLTVTADREGYDQYFQTPKTDFGRGALIVRYTDYNNNTSEPQIYTNYLEANTVVGADTKVQLFEEGDYEVALDYQVTKDQLIDKDGHYRIFFKFAVRNGNCMVYPFDVESGSELTNSSMTENGFRLDLAKSRYLKVNVKREILSESADGLVEDTRSNGPAKDGASYTDEGIYTITVNNQYTDQFTTKKIYVGTNNIMKAYMTTGLSIPEINSLVEDGAIIANDGTIKLSAKAEEKMESTEEDTKTNKEVRKDNDTNQLDEEDINKGLISVPIILVLGVILIIIFKQKAKKKKVKGGNEE